MKKTKGEILNKNSQENSGFSDFETHVYSGSNKDEVISNVYCAMQTFADQETSTLYTRAQLLEFGEKVREECAEQARALDSGPSHEVDKQSILIINIENILNK